MGTLFDDCPEYPDYAPTPRFTATINGTVVPLAIAAALYGLCPVTLIDHDHPPHDEHPVDLQTAKFTAVSSISSGGDVTVALTGVSATGEIGSLAPSIAIAL